MVTGPPILLWVDNASHEKLLASCRQDCVRGQEGLSEGGRDCGRPWRGGGNNGSFLLAKIFAKVNPHINLSTDDKHFLTSFYED